ALNVFRLKTARGVPEAVDEAFNIVGHSARIWVMPFGNHTLPEVKTVEQQQPQEQQREQTLTTVR
ncbi:MAG: hypothetical protein AB1457_18890, partial [Chloroflexota bacterium]